jgi:hypothetical protein
MPGLLTAKFRDKSDEYSTFSVLVPVINGTTRIWTDITTLGASLESAVEDISLCTLVSLQYRQIANTEDDSQPASGFANREAGLRFFYSDDSNAKKYHITVPGPDYGTIDTAGSDEIPLTQTEVAAMVTWMEAEMVSVDGNSITVDRVVKVGRNN